MNACTTDKEIVIDAPISTSSATTADIATISSTAWFITSLAPSWLKIVMECFVVIVGFLILAGAVNTSMVGSNGVLNRLAEDGVLTPWFQHPHKRFGTTNRLINLVGTMQVMVIVASLGDVNTLGEAYAFGVVWSFVFMSLSMAVLRFKDRSPRKYRCR